jgi:hypothetical protein
MKYMLLVYASESGWNKLPETERQTIYDEYMALVELPEVVSSHRLQPPNATMTVRGRDGETLVTDGPFVETKEVLGGYYLVEVVDLDAALRIAARIPAPRHGGAVEVRPVADA